MSKYVFYALYTKYGFVYLHRSYRRYLMAYLASCVFDTISPLSLGCCCFRFPYYLYRSIPNEPILAAIGDLFATIEAPQNTKKKLSSSVEQPWLCWCHLEAYELGNILAVLQFVFSESHLVFLLQKRDLFFFSSKQQALFQ